MKKLVAAVASASSFLLPLLAGAQPTGIPDNTVLQGGLYGVRQLIIDITNWMFVFLLVLAVLFIILAAYRYMFSQGSEEGVSAAHKMLIYAVVAIAVAFVAKGIVFVVQQLVTGGSGGTAGPALNGGGGSGGSGVGIGGYYDSDGNWRVNVGFGN